ncbi:MAG: hypothetical protein KDC44_14730, partial [Phaeodactylibacter sp.]|nr:hypothetical protein [Phaeodactylibacter sp.]
NTNQTLVELFDVVRKYHPDYPEEKVAKEVLSRKMFGKEPDYSYNDKKMRDLLSDLMLLFERFMAIEELEGRSKLPMLLLADKYDAKNEPDLFLQVTRKLSKPLTNPKVKGAEHFETFWELGRRVVLHPNRLPRGIFKLERVMEAQDRHYIRERLPLLCNYFSEKLQRNLDFVPLFLEETLNYLANLAETPKVEVALLLYHQIFTWYQQEVPGEQGFQEMKELFAGHWPEMSSFDVRIIGVMLNNICIHLVRTAGPKYREDLWELYKIGLTSRRVLINDRLTDTAYTNIAVLACSLGQLAWAEAFVNTYAVYLDPAVSDSARSYALAYLKYTQGDLEAVQELLNTVEFAIVEYGLRGRSLMLRMYFEDEAPEGHFSELIMFYFEAFRRYVDRQSNKVNKKTLKSYQNLIQVTRRLVKILNNRSANAEEQLARLSKHVREMDDLALKPWVFGQIRHFSSKL